MIKMKPVKTWFVIADHQKVRFLENDGLGHGLSTVDIPCLTAHIQKKGDNQTGRVQDSTGDHRHKLETNDSNNISLITNDLLEQLYKSKERGLFDRVVICAAPRMLGDIRSKIAPQFKQFVYAELDKNLVHTRLEDLPEHFKDFILL
jgi:protein required for attachment to host cells